VKLIFRSLFDDCRAAYRTGPETGNALPIIFARGDAYREKTPNRNGFRDGEGLIDPIRELQPASLLR